MKAFLKLTLLALGLGVVALPVIHAAKDDAIGKGRHPRLRALLKQRAAVRGQVARRLDLGQDQIAQLKSLRNDTTLTKEQKHAKAREILQGARNSLTPEKKAGLRGQAARRLDLGDNQIAQLKAERAKVADALKAIRNDTTLTKEQKRARARETIQSARSEFRGVLTPEQQSKIDQFRVRRQGGRAGRI